MKITLNCLKKTLLTVFITSICLLFSTGCIFNGIFGDENKTGSNDSSSPNYVDYRDDPTFSGEHTNPLDTSNLILNVDFDNNNSHKPVFANSNIITDATNDKWFNSYRPYEVLFNKHKKVCQLKRGGALSYIAFQVNINEPSSLSFDYRPNTSVPNDLHVQYYKMIDGKKELFTYNQISYTPEKNGKVNTWLKATVPLKVGINTIFIYTPAHTEYVTGTFYIDNITIAPDKVAHVDIYPKGLQETYVGGDEIQFQAFPLRSDRSVITNQNISYSVSGCGSIDNNGLFTPQSAGNCTITAYVNDIPYRKENVIVHRKDYLLDPIKIGDYEFKGCGKAKFWDAWKPVKDSSGNITSRQGPSSFSADGFFVLEGNTNEPLWIQIVKQEGRREYKTEYYIRDVGKFSKRIWLRFGKGDYKVYIVDMSKEYKHNKPNDNFEGDIISIKGNILKTLNVTNTNSISLEEALVLMPSEVVQSDDFKISNKAHAIVADLPSDINVSDVLRSIHDWETRSLHYDTDSLIENKRKKQDALYTMKNSMGVCEGYANLYAAIARAVGIRTKVIGGNAVTNSGSGPHAWNNVLYKYHWYLVDTTFDDPVYRNEPKAKAPLAENYTHFITNPNDSNHHISFEELPRSVIEIEEDILSSSNNCWY